MLIASTDIEAKQLINLYDADPGRVEVVHPGVDLDRVPSPRHRRTRAVTSACRRTPTSCCSPAGSSRSRRPTCCCTRSHCCSTRTRPSGRDSSSRSSAGPPAPGSSTPRRWPSWPTGLAIADVVRFVPPVPPAELALLGRRGLDAGRRAVVQRVLRAGRRRGPGRRHAGDRRRGRRPDDGRRRRRAAGCSSTPTSPTPGRPRCGGSCSTTRCAPGWRQGARERGQAFSWEHTAERTLDVYERARHALRELV